MNLHQPGLHDDPSRTESDRPARSRISVAQRRLAPLTALLVLVLALMPILASAQDGGGRPSAPVITEPGVRGPSIVLTDAGTDPEVVAADNGVATGFVYRSAVNGFSADLSDVQVANLQQDSDVESISIDRLVSTDAVPNQLRRVGADTSATSGVGTGASHPEVGIAIVDSGVGPNNDINVVGGVDCTGSGGVTTDTNGHGTHVAGIAAAKDNGDSTTGIAPGASIYSVKVLIGSSGPLSNVICGLNWIAANPGGIDVVNMSLGLSQGAGAACGTAGVYPLRAAVCGVTNQGVQVVVAAGNQNGTNANNYSPASYSEVTSVSAYTDTDGRTGGLGGTCLGGDDQIATYSNVNADIMAPGSCITSNAPGGGTTVKSGTSMASPLVAGAIGLYGSLGAVSIPRTDPKGGVTSGDPLVLYIGNGTIPGGGGTATPTPRPATATATTRPATATATTRPATATPAATATRRPRSTSTPRPGTVTATTRPATATATTRPTTATPRPGTATATTRPATATPTTRPGTVTATARPTRPPRTGVTGQEAGPTVTVAATATRATRSPRGTGQSTATATVIPATATLAPTDGPTAVPTEEPTETPTATVTEEPTVSPTETPTEVVTEEPTLAPTAIPTDVPTEIPTEVPTEVPTDYPTEIPTEIPTEEPTLVPTEVPTIDPAAVTDTFFTGTAWYAADDEPLTTWYMDVPAPAQTDPAVEAPVDESGEVPVDGADGTGEIPTDVPAEVVVEPTAEPEDLALEIDLGYVQTVGSVRWQWTETTYAHGAEVQVSLDGEIWTTVAYPDTYNAIPGEWQEIQLGIDTQYVRFLFPNAEQLTVVGGLNEVEVLPLPAI